MKVGSIVRQRLNHIRAVPEVRIPIQRKWIQVFISFFLGAVLGFLAKYFDNTQIVGEIGTYLGFWVLTAALLSAWSRSPRAAAVHVFVFFAAVLLIYYTYSMILFGFFPRYYFLAWGGIALLSPICGTIVWYARGSGWTAAFCASLPISLLLVEGYSFFYTLSIPRGFDVLAAVFLFVILADKANQRLQILMMTGVVFFVFWKLNVISMLFGGL